MGWSEGRARLFALVVHGEAVEHMGACLVEADHLHRHAVATIFQHHLVERADCGDVP